MLAAQELLGCVYYAFAQDLTDPNTFHLTEGYSDLESYERHENAASFLSALKTVVQSVRILDRQGVRYDIASMHIDDPWWIGARRGAWKYGDQRRDHS